MKPLAITATAAITIMLFLSGCSSEEESQPLLTENYTKWERTTEEPLDFPVPGHGSGERIIYINPRGQEVEAPEDQDEPWEYPVGTLIVKEVYPSPDPPEDAPPASLAVMLKDPEDPKSRGGWVWFTTKPGSDEERVFTEQFCVTCHANANEEHPYGDGNPEEQFRDYVYYPYR